jgi:cytochrome c oxidase subunit 2
MLAGAGVIFLLVGALTFIAINGPGAWRAALRKESLVIQLGLIFPIVVLSVLLLAGFGLMRAGPAPGGAGEPVRIAVVGEQWWWRVSYVGEDGRRFDSANEIVIPVGRPVEIELTSADVIHSFWAPAYAGKVDMVPGRTNRITLYANTPGVRRGQCAEYCGGAHALMSFHVVALPLEEFERRLRHEAADAAGSGNQDGRRLFLETGCGACHAVRGTRAEGIVGPDLTHVAGRQALGAGLLATDTEGFAAWVANHRQVKPGNRMPAFDFLTAAEIRSISNYLASLE